MSSSLITSSIVSKLTLINFENQLVVANKVDWQYSEKFGKGDDQIGTSYSIRRPIMVLAVENNMAWNASISGVTESKVTLTIDRTLTTPLSFNDADLKLKIEKFNSRFMAPVCRTQASKLDAAILNALSNCTGGSTNFETGAVGTPSGSINSAGYVVGTWGTALTTDVIATAKQVLLDKGCPMDDGDLVGILCTNAQRKLVQIPLTQFNPLAKVDEKYRKGQMGEFDGINFSVSQSCASHTNGAVATITPAVAAATESSASWVETCTMVVPALSGAVKAGDVFTATGVYCVNPFTKVITSTPFQVTVVADAAQSATAIVVTPAPILTGAYQNISATLNGKALALVDSANATGQESYIFHKSAIACASIELSAPKSSSYDMVEQINAPDADSFNIRFLRSYDMIGASGAFGSNNPGFIGRFDVAWGMKTAQPEFIIRLRCA